MKKYQIGMVKDIYWYLLGASEHDGCGSITDVHLAFLKQAIEELEIKQTPENLKKMKIGRLLATKIIHSWELKDYFDDILWKDDEFADAQEAIAKIIANTNLTYLTNLQQ